MSIKELKLELKYQKEMLKIARTPHQRDSGKFKIRKLKSKIRRHYEINS